MLAGMQDQAGIDALEGVETEGELGDDAEVAASAAQTPEELRSFGLAGTDDRAVCQDDFGADEVIRGQAILTHKPAQPAAEGQAGDTGRRDRATGSGQTVGLGSGIEIGPGGATASPSDALLG